MVILLVRGVATKRCDGGLILAGTVKWPPEVVATSKWPPNVGRIKILLYGVPGDYNEIPSFEGMTGKRSFACSTLIGYASGGPWMSLRMTT